MSHSRIEQKVNKKFIEFYDGGGNPRGWHYTLQGASRGLNKVFKFEKKDFFRWSYERFLNRNEKYPF